MNAKQRSKRRNLVTVKITAPFIIYFGRMIANQAISFKANPWQIFKQEK